MKNVHLGQVLLSLLPEEQKSSFDSDFLTRPDPKTQPEKTARLSTPHVQPRTVFSLLSTILLNFSLKIAMA